MLKWIAVAALGVAAQISDFDQGVALVQQGKPEAAIAPLTRATDKNPADARAWKALGVAYASLSRYEAAEPPFRRACELAPKLEDACYYHGRALYALNRFDESLVSLERAAAARSEWKVDLGVGQALEALGRAAEAEQALRKAILQCRGAEAAPGVALGLFLIRQGRLQEALAPLEEAVRRFPSSADAHTYLGRIRLERGEVPGSIDHLERAVALAPASAQAHLLLAKAYVRAGRAAEAQPHFEAAARSEAAAQGRQ